MSGAMGGMVDIMHTAATRDGRQAAATAYLHRTGNTDLLPILGLTPTPARARPVRVRYADRPAKTCPACGQQFAYKRSATCSRECGMTYRSQRLAEVRS